MTNAPGINPASVFVVSGGGRGITARCVVRLAQEYHCKFILLGRSSTGGMEPEWANGITEAAQLKKKLISVALARGEKPTPARVEKEVNNLLARREVEDTLHQINAAGGKALYLSVDITDFSPLREALDGAVGRLGPITGILHGAGNLADKLIENKTVDDFEKVYAAKVQGLENLLRYLAPGNLKHLILFSSVAGFYGNSGQADYSLANEILNKTAHLVKRQYPDCRVLSVNWGPWDGGMVTPALKEFFAERNIEVIPVETGAQMLVNELNLGQSETVQIVIGSPLTAQPSAPDQELKTYQIRRKLTLEGNPFLLDHVIGGNPVLPAICVINWVANACEQLYPGYTFFSSENNRVLKGVVFDNSMPTEFTLELIELAKTAEGELTFDATIWSFNENNRKQYHYGARATLRRKAAPVPVINDFNLTPSQTEEGDELYRNGVLFHGPSFQGVRRVLNMSRERVTLECLLPLVNEEYQGQFPVRTFNPYAVDVQLQCLLIWARHFYQAASLPLKIQQVDQFRPLLFGVPYYATMQVQTSSNTGLVATVFAHDKDGRVYTKVTGAEVTISERLNKLFEPSKRVASALTSV